MFKRSDKDAPPLTISGVEDDVEVEVPIAPNPSLKEESTGAPEDRTEKLPEPSSSSQDVSAEYKKKLRALQNELEESQEDLDDLQKRIRKKDDEIDSLQTRMLANEKELGSIREQNAVLTKRLVDKQAELALSQEALDFVKEVLTAQVTDDNKSRTLYSKVTAISDFVRTELRDTIVKYSDSSTEMGKETEDEIFGNGLVVWAARKKKTWLDGKTSVAFVGEFSAGKTSIVNRILSQDNPDVPLLPVSTEATTAIPTYITGTEAGALYQFVTPDNSLKCISPETFRRVSKAVLDQIQGVSSLIKYFVMGYENPNLERISVLDTPGFSSNDSEDSARTIEVINECDALFWVFDVNNGAINRSSLALIKNNLKRPLYIVINKVDTKPVEKEIDQVEDTIRETFAAEGIQIEEVIRFSRTSPLEDIMQPISSITRDVLQDNYLSLLKDYLNSVKDEAKSKTTDGKKRLTTLAKQLKSMDKQFGDAIGSLYTECEEASAIPQYKGGFLGIGKGYRMDADQYDELISKLQTIKGERVDTIIELFDEIQLLSEDYGKSDEQYGKDREKYIMLQEIQKHLNQLAKNI